MLEGLVFNVDSKFKVLVVFYLYFVKRFFIDLNLYLRDVFIELLFKDGKFRLE